MTDGSVPREGGGAPTSSTLLDRIKAHEPEAWRRLLHRYGPLVYRWCRQAGLRESDSAGAMPAAVVTESFAKRFLPRVDPIGVRFKYSGMEPVNPVYTIVGVERFAGCDRERDTRVTIVAGWRRHRPPPLARPFGVRGQV